MCVQSSVLAGLQVFHALAVGCPFGPAAPPRHRERSGYRDQRIEHSGFGVEHGRGRL